MNDIADSLETMILMLLEAKEALSEETIGTTTNFLSGIKTTVKKGSNIGISEMYPKKSYTLDLSDLNRIKEEDVSIDFLLDHPSEIIGYKNEFSYFSNDAVFWIGFKKLQKVPIGFFPFGKSYFYYELHMRDYKLGQKPVYQNIVISIDKNGHVLPAIYNNKKIKPDSFEILLVSACAAIEDAHRSNAMLAQVSDATQLLFPVPLDDYKEVFSKRDLQPTEIRRKAILHWVAKHIRKSVNKNNHLVKKHTRGIDEFTVDGLKVKISANQVL